LGKINFFATSGAGVGPIKFIGKNFFLLAAARAFANKGFKGFKVVVAGTVLGGRCLICHEFLLAYDVCSYIKNG
jgi:hypothetical protein